MFRAIKDFLFKNTSDKQTVIKNTIWLVGSELTVRLARFFLILYVARILGAEGWGLFSYTLSLLGTALVFSDAGISFLLIKEYSGQRKRLLKTILILKMILLGISSILAIFIGFFFASFPIASLVIPVALTLFFDSARDFLSTLLRAKEKMEVEALIKTITNISLVGISIFSVFLYKTPAALAIGYASGSFIGIILTINKTLPLLKEIIKDFKKTENNSLFLKEVSYIIGPVTISTLATTIILNVDTIMLGIWKTPEDVGFYASAQRVFFTLMTIPSLFSIAILPKLSVYFSENKTFFKKLSSESLSILILIGTPIAIGGFILAEPIMTLMFGSGYIESGRAFALLILGAVFAFPATLLNSLSLITNKQVYIAINTCVAVAISVVLNVYLIPRYGIFGAAIGTTITQFILFVSNFIVLRKNFKIEIKDILIIIATAFIMGFVVFKLKDLNILLSIFIGALIFIVTLFITNKNIFKLFITKNNLTDLS